MRPGGRRVLEPRETIGASFMPLGRSGAVTAVAFLVADLASPLPPPSWVPFSAAC